MAENVNYPYHECEFKAGQKAFMLMTQHFGFKEGVDNLFSVLYSIVGSIAVFGNACALYFFFNLGWNGLPSLCRRGILKWTFHSIKNNPYQKQQKRSRNTTSKIFYTSFAVFDLITGICGCFTGFLFAKTRPALLCSKIVGMPFFKNFFGILEYLSIHCTTYIISLMSVSRCVGVLLPFRYKELFTPFGCYIMIGIVVGYPFLISILPFFFGEEYVFTVLNAQYGYQFHDLTNEDKIVNNTLIKPIADGLKVTLTQVPIIISVIVMVISSIIVAVYLINNQRNTIGANDTNRSSQYSASITILILATIFALTYVPFLVILLLDIANKNAVINAKDYWVFLPVVYLTFYLSSAINPFVYHLRGRSVFEREKRKKTTVVFSNQTRMSIMTETGADKRKQSQEDHL